MQNLRDQLLKAKVIDKKTKKVADIQARTEDRKKGYESTAQEAEARSKAFEEKREEQRAEDRRREKERLREQRSSEGRFRLRDLVRDGAIREGRHGPRRFYFVTRAGRIPFVQVAEELAKQLETGRAAIVESPSSEYERFEVVTRSAAERIAEVDAEMVRFWNR